MKYTYIKALLLLTLSSETLAFCPTLESSLTIAQKKCLSEQFDDEKIHLFARKTSRISDDAFTLDGDVCIKQADLRLFAPELLYNHTTQIFDSKGGIILQNQNQTVNAQTAKVFTAEQTATLGTVSYKLLDSDISGTADQFNIEQQKSTISRLSFSTCPPAKRDWEIVAKEAVLEHEEGVGTFKGATLRFKNIPVLYFPWIKLPLNDDRRSGLLIPNLSYSSNTGLDFSMPYYFNISTNIDATLTPRYLQNHGLMLGGEFRYLTANNQGVFSATYLPDDDIRNRDRSLIEYKHQTRLGSGWLLNANINNVTDRQYFEDFSSSSFLTSTPFLRSSINLKGNGEKWLFFAGINDYQVLSDTISVNSLPYQKLPEISFSWFDHHQSTRTNYGIRTEVVNFYRENSLSAWRTDLQPWIEKKFSNSWSWFTPKMQYRSTRYQFDDDRANISRNLPIYSADFGLKFEKAFSNGAYNSLEPRLFYVYVPDRDQSNIPLFDTHGLTFGSNLLFQTNQFSGADRQSDMNQVAASITHRSFDSAGAEKWNFTLGQIKYFDDQSVQLRDNFEDFSKSPLIAEVNYYMLKNWSAAFIMHYDQSLNEAERGLLRFQRKDKHNNLFNLAYRFRRNRIEQIDTSLVIPIKDSHRILARWNYSLEDNKIIESLFGYEHKNCCWAFRIMSRKYLIDESGNVNNGIYLEIQLNGLGSIGRNPRRILQQSILGYNEEF